MEKRRLSRRSFLKGSAAAVATKSVLSTNCYKGVKGAGNRLNVGIVGCGRIAESHLKSLLSLSEGENVATVAVCDVYESRARKFQGHVSQSGGDAQYFSDYRKLLEMQGLDCVAITTPEHSHAQIAIDALDSGLHVYCEKAMTQTVDQAYAVLEKVRGSKLKFQVGVQGMSDDSYESAHQAIRAGKLGPVVSAQIEYVRRHPLERGPWRVGIDPDLPKPPDLNWEAWLGPAPKRPWSAPRYFEWRNYRDYSGGIATDLFVHRITRILKACGLGNPSRVVGMGGIYLWDDGRDLPDNLEMLAEYPPAQGITPGMTLHVLGTMANNHPLEHLIRGHQATLKFTREGWEIIAQDGDEVIERHQKTGSESISLHYRNLFNAIRSGEELKCPAELGLYGVTAVAGVVQSWFEKRSLTWDTDRNQWT